MDRGKLLLLVLVSVTTAAYASSRGAEPDAPTESAAKPEEVSFITYATPASGFRLLDTCHFSDDGRRLLLTADAPRKGVEVVQVFDVTTAKGLFSRRRGRPQTVVLMADAISPDGSRIILSETDPKLNRHLHVIDVESGQTLWTRTRSAASDAAFLRDRDLILDRETLEHGVVRLSLFDLRKKDNELAWAVEVKKPVSPMLRMSPDGRLLFAIADFDSPDLYGVFSLETRRLQSALEQSRRLQTPHFRLVPSGAEVMGLGGGDLSVWDASTGKILRRTPLRAWRPGITHAVFSPDGAFLYLSTGNTIHVHNTADGSLIHTETFSIPPDLAVAGPDHLLGLRTFPGQLRFIRLRNLDAAGGNRHP
jgi:dipeptidyl aminopeptidase/acylaminoacyl peptidase